MLEGVRRAIAHRKEEKRKAKLKEIEVGRRLSVIQTKRYEERIAAEKELGTQTGTEIGTLTEAKAAYQERKRAERELRGMRPGIGRRLARGAGRVGRGVFYTLPIKTARAFTDPEAGRKAQRFMFGGHEKLFGPTKPSQPTKPTESMDDFIFGKKTPGKTNLGEDILGKDTKGSLDDILK